MSNKPDGLDKLLGLEPLVADTMSFSDFLGSLKEHPERADTAAALFVRAVKALGEENIDEAHPGRQPYLRMLRSMKIPSYKAFAGVRGSQRVVARLMKRMEAAANGGNQLAQMALIFGGPGCGKSFLVDHTIKVLEGQIVYAVAGCPEHESPINLLTLLSKERLFALSDALGMVERNEAGAVVRDRFADLMKTAQEPCGHCFRALMGIDNPLHGAGHNDHEHNHGCHGGACEKGEYAHNDASTTATEASKEPVLNETVSKEPNLAAFKVEALRLSSRNAGISVWTPTAPGQGCSLPAALRQGNRGMARLQEAFDAKGAEAGSVSQLQVLLEATQGRRMPTSAVNCESASGFIPLDQILIAETNEGAWIRFVKEQEDPGKWHRRGDVLVMDYITAVCEEVAAYGDFMKQLKAVPTLDPLALRLIATAAVASRMKENIEGLTLEQRIRMYNGEPLIIEKNMSSVNRSNNPWNGMYGNYGSGAGTKSASSEESDDKNYSVADLWMLAGEDEGRTGLDMSFMLSSVSQLCELGLVTKHQCVTALQSMHYLRARIERELGRPGLPDNYRRMFERAKKYLSMATSKNSTSELIEGEYRRLLKAQVLQAFSPDYEARAEEMFQRYQQHAVAWAKGKDRVFDKRFNREIPIALDHLKKIEDAMGKSGDSAFDFRRSLESEFIELMRASARHEEGDAPKAVVFNWQTHPEIKKAIKKILDDEIAAKVERILTEETNLTEDERKLRSESIERFDRFGYSEPCRKAALAYFKEFELWK